MRVKYLPQDNEARLNRGICFYDGHPYYLELISQVIASLSPLAPDKNRPPITVDLTDQKLDISSPVLGYVNTKAGKAVYLMRKPERKYKQLVNIGSISGIDPISGISWGQDALHSLLHSKQGENMLLGVYPALTEVISKLTNKTTSLAISRNVALGIRADRDDLIRVYYKLDEVGTIDLKKGNIVSIPSHEVAWVISRNLEGFDWEVK